MARHRTVSEILQANESNKALLDITTNINKFLYENRNARPTEKNYLHAAEFMAATAGFEINMEQATAILELYPQARIKLAVYDGLGDTEVRDLVADAVADFFLGCRWPTYGDNVDTSLFCAVLHARAKAMGFI